MKRALLDGLERTVREKRSKASCVYLRELMTEIEALVNDAALSNERYEAALEQYEATDPVASAVCSQRLQQYKAFVQEVVNCSCEHGSRGRAAEICDSIESGMLNHDALQSLLAGFPVHSISSDPPNPDSWSTPECRAATRAHSQYLKDRYGAPPESKSLTPEAT